MTRLGVTEAQVETCMSNAVVDEKRVLRYGPFARAAALLCFEFWQRNPFENVTVELEPQHKVGDEPRS